MFFIVVTIERGGRKLVVMARVARIEKEEKCIVEGGIGVEQQPL